MEKTVIEQIEKLRQPKKKSPPYYVPLGGG